MEERQDIKNLLDQEQKIIAESGITIDDIKMLTTSESLTEEERSKAAHALELWQESSKYAQLKAEKAKLEAQVLSLKKEILAKSGKVGRNDPCPCGSGKKFKNCCLKLMD